MVLVVLVACSNDFGLADIEKPVSSDTTDTAAPPPEDSATPPDTDTTPTGGTPADDSSTTPSEETEPDTDTPDDPPPEDDCTDTDDLVYVLARDDGGLYLFDPTARSFTSLGRVSCSTSQTPASMAVSRDGFAYVRYADDSLFVVDLATMGCTRSGYSDRASGFGSFGMGYATDTADTWRERLYVASDTRLGVLDSTTWTITDLGRMPSQSELTGNADGELWAMLPLERPAELVRLDTTSGATLETLRLSAFPDPADIDTFAFATWGGAFYLFVRESGMGNSTDVYEVTASGAMTRVLSDIGFDVVGAGVSTCAPS